MLVRQASRATERDSRRTERWALVPYIRVDANAFVWRRGVIFPEFQQLNHIGPTRRRSLLSGTSILIRHACQFLVLMGESEGEVGEMQTDEPVIAEPAYPTLSTNAIAT